MRLSCGIVPSPNAPEIAALAEDLGYHRAWFYDWNKYYANTAYGQPVALVVPPTATMQTNYGWGVASSRLERLTLGNLSFHANGRIA